MNTMMWILGVGMVVAVLFEVVTKLLKKHVAPKLEKTQRLIEDDLAEMARRALDE